MSDTTDPKLCCYKQCVKTSQTKNLTFQTLKSALGLFGLKSSHGFVILCGRIEPIARFVFYLVINMWENLYKKSYQSWQTAVKTFKKHQNVPAGTHKKRQTLIHKFLG